MNKIFGNFIVYSRNDIACIRTTIDGIEYYIYPDKAIGQYGFMVKGNELLYFDDIQEKVIKVFNKEELSGKELKDIIDIEYVTADYHKDSQERKGAQQLNSIRFLIRANDKNVGIVYIEPGNRKMEASIVPSHVTDAETTLKVTQTCFISKSEKKIYCVDGVIDYNGYDLLYAKNQTIDFFKYISNYEAEALWVTRGYENVAQQELLGVYYRIPRDHRMVFEYLVVDGKVAKVINEWDTNYDSEYDYWKTYAYEVEFTNGEIRTVMLNDRTRFISGNGTHSERIDCGWTIRSILGRIHYRICTIHNQETHSFFIIKTPNGEYVGCDRNGKVFTIDEIVADISISHIVTGIIDYVNLDSEYERGTKRLHNQGKNLKIEGNKNKAAVKFLSELLEDQKNNSPKIKELSR